MREVLTVRSAASGWYWALSQQRPGHGKERLGAVYPPRVKGASYGRPRRLRTASRENDTRSE
jgi:hypothetical protein